MTIGCESALSKRQLFSFFPRIAHSSPVSCIKEHIMYVGQPYNPFGRQLSRAVRSILIVTVGAFLVQWLVNQRTGGFFTAVFGLSWDELIHGSIWQPVTYMFLHAGPWHILINMLMLYFFGCEMEDVLGTRRFVGLYFGCGAAAGIGWVIISALTGRYGYCIGASGAVFGIMGAFAAMFPDRMITLLLFFVLPVTISARMMAIGFGLLSLFGLLASDGNIAHSAHLVGGVAGYIYGLRIARNPRVLDADSYADSNVFARWQGHTRAFIRRRKRRVLPEEEALPSQEEVNRILEKITDKGIQSLSSKERRSLEKASGSKR